MTASSIDWAPRLLPLTPIYVLIDPLLGDAFPTPGEGLLIEAIQALRNEQWGRSTYAVALPDGVDLRPEQAPYLVELEGLDDPWFEQTIEMAHEECELTWAGGVGGRGTGARKIGGWLQSSLHGHQVATQLGQWMRLKTASVHTTAKYLRLADSRVLDLCRHIFGESPMANALGRVSRWVYLSAQGQARVLAGQATGTLEDNERGWHWQPTQWPLFQKDSWQKLERGVLMHPAIAIAHGQCLQDGLPTSADGDIFERAWQASVSPLAPATQRFVRSDMDRVMVIALSLLHPGWSQRLQAQSWLEQEGPDTAESASLHELGVALHAYLLTPAARRSSP